MPTTRPRHIITETDVLARALDIAAGRWPQDAGSRARLLRHLLDEGIRAVSEDRAGQQLAWEARVREAAGMLDDTSFGPGYIQTLREDWPE